jgi:hypothetical protein
VVVVVVVVAATTQTSCSVCRRCKLSSKDENNATSGLKNNIYKTEMFCILHSNSSG